MTTTKTISGHIFMPALIALHYFTQWSIVGYVYAAINVFVLMAMLAGLYALTHSLKLFGQPELNELRDELHAEYRKEVTPLKAAFGCALALVGTAYWAWQGWPITATIVLIAYLVAAYNIYRNYRFVTAR